MCLSTKVGIKEGYKADMSYDSVISACDESLERLDTSYVDFYFVHFDDPDTPVERTIGALEDLKMDGKIDNYGLSHLPIERVKEYVEEGDVAVSMLELSAVSRQAKKELLPFYNEHDIGAFAFSVTGRGILTGKFDEVPKFDPGDIRNMDPLFKHARFESGLRITEKMDEIGEKYEKSSVRVAINWVINQDGIISALTGPSSIDHLEENVGGSGWDIHEEDMDELDSFLEKEEERLKRTEPEMVKKILTQELPDHKGTAFNDLVYAIETSINHGMVSERKIISLFQKLITMQKSEKGLTFSGLKEIQNQIKNKVL
ncbi:MAG: aldo/keto reductase [Thermoplasmatota archaeon]